MSRSLPELGGTSWPAAVETILSLRDVGDQLVELQCAALLPVNLFTDRSAQLGLTLLQFPL